MKIAALDIGGTQIKYCLYDTNRPFHTDIMRSFPTNAKQGAQAVIEGAMQIVEQLAPFDRIGISTAGQVHAETGEILFATDNIPNYTGVQLAHLFTERFHVPTIVENDVNSAILAEVLFGLGSHEGFIIGLTYGTGIGGAIIHHGELFRGHNYAAGEFGHILTHAGGAPCTCGKKGCYEAYASTGALIRSAERAMGETLDGLELMRRHSEPLIAALIDDWVQEVVYGLVTIVHTFNPSFLILGGGIMENAFILEAISKKLVFYVLPGYRGIQVRGTSLGNASGLRGAIYLAQTMRPF